MYCHEGHCTAVVQIFNDSRFLIADGLYDSEDSCDNIPVFLCEYRPNKLGNNGSIAWAIDHGFFLFIFY